MDVRTGFQQHPAGICMSAIGRPAQRQILPCVNIRADFQQHSAGIGIAFFGGQYQVLIRVHLVILVVCGVRDNYWDDWHQPERSP